MSASLVGSEMCIRDRLQGCLKLHTSAQICWMRFGPSVVNPCGRPPDLRAVSYTHLTLPTICSV
eukprot:7586336-Alexandrium_andersonii.AAC.1